MPKSPNGAAPVRGPDRPRERYDQVRVIASHDGLVVKDARGGNMAVLGVDIGLRPGLPPVMIMRLISGPFDVQGTPQFLVADPATGQPKAAKRIEWHDGTSVDFPEPPAPKAPAIADADVPLSSVEAHMLAWVALDAAPVRLGDVRGLVLNNLLAKGLVTWPIPEGGSAPDDALVSVTPAGQGRAAKLPRPETADGETATSGPPAPRGEAG